MQSGFFLFSSAAFLSDGVSFYFAFLIIMIIIFDIYIAHFYMDMIKCTSQINTIFNS